MKSNFITAAFLIFMTALSVQAAPPAVITGTDRLAMSAGYSAREARQKNYAGDLTVSRGNVHYRSYLHFDLRGLPSRPVKDVKLFLYSRRQYHSSPAAIGFYELKQSFQEKTCSYAEAATGIAWQNPPADFQKPLGILEVGCDQLNCWMSVSSPTLTATVDRWLKNPALNHGFLLQDTRKYKGPCFKFFGCKKDSAEFLPKLVISFDAPVNPADFGVITPDQMIIRRLTRDCEKLLAHAGAADRKHLQSIISSLRSRITISWPEEEEIGLELQKIWFRSARSIQPQRSLAVWSLSPWQFLDRDALPGAPAEDWQGILLQNEIHEMALGLTNITPQRLLCAIRISGLPKNAFRLRSTYWVEGVRAKQDIRPDLPRYGWVDDVLVPLFSDKHLILPPRTHTRLWLTVDGRKLSPGCHSFTLNLSDSDNGNCTLHGSVKVLPRKLVWPETLHISSYAYLDRPCTSRFRKLAQQNILNHYENTFVSNCSLLPSWNKKNGTWDFSGIRSYLKFARQGKPKMLLFFWNGPFTVLTPKDSWNSPQWQNRLKEAVIGWGKICQEEGFSKKQFAFYPVDEVYAYPSGKNYNAYQRLLDIARVIRSADPEFLIFANPVCFRKDDLKYFQALQPYVSIWAPIAELFRNADHHGHPRPFTLADKKLNRKFFTAEQAAGKLLWTYRCDGPVKILNVNSYYRQFSWEPWLSGVTGLGIWSYNDIRGSSWSDADRGDFSMIYELRDAPEEIQRRTTAPILPSVRYKAWRRSLQDYALMEMAAAKAGRSAVEKIVFRGLQQPAEAVASENIRLQLLNIIGE